MAIVVVAICRPSPSNRESGSLGADHVATRHQIIATRLERIYQLACSTCQVARFAVFGSFVTEKDEPNDVDVIMIMEDSFDLASVSGEAALVFQHSEADAHFGASVFWVRRSAALGGEQALVAGC